MSPNQADSERQDQLVVHQQFEGPLPPPAVLEYYDRIVPGAASRIISMAEDQSKHRMGLEKSVIESGIKNSSRGLFFGLFIALCALSIALILGLQGERILAGVIGGGSLVSLVSVFVYGSEERKKERKTRQDEAQKDN